ncbi:hypothetical protein [Schaalia sp. JY-X169]|uniref:hypothetical protein n=1 Tax=Schaalia sp. JY-X169 TaxID=2758572 RepID=UPI0015F6D180|nr:hypothetical protein [Schaalia sp. JY-X169]
MGKQSDLGDESDALIATVKKELTAIRGAQGILDAQKFNNYPNLVRVCGGGDLLEAFLMFGREMRRYASEGNRNEAAAALSITAPAETVLDRLEYVVGVFEERGQIRDQRTGRRWSDNGISTIAKDLVYIAEVKGRLGTEMLTIEIDGGFDEGLFLSIYQLTTKNLDETAPLIRLWKHARDSDEIQEKKISVDLEKVPATVASNQQYRSARHLVHIELPQDVRDAQQVTAGTVFYSISIEGRDAPMRTVTFADSSQPDPDIGLQFTAYRTLATIDIVAK